MISEGRFWGYQEASEAPGVFQKTFQRDFKAFQGDFVYLRGLRNFQKRFKAFQDSGSFQGFYVASGDSRGFRGLQ